MKYTSLFIALSTMFITSATALITTEERELVNSFDFVLIDNGDAVKIDFDGLKREKEFLANQPVERGLKLLDFAEKALLCFYLTQSDNTKTQYAQAAQIASVLLNTQEAVDDSIRARACVCLGRMWKEKMMSFVRWGVSFDELRGKNKQYLRALEESNGIQFYVELPTPADIMRDTLLMGSFLSLSGALRQDGLYFKDLMTSWGETLSFRPRGTSVYRDWRYAPNRLNVCFIYARHYFLRAITFGSWEARKHFTSLYRDIGAEFYTQLWQAFCDQYPEQPLPDASTQSKDVHASSSGSHLVSSLRTRVEGQQPMRNEFENSGNTDRSLALAYSGKSKKDD